MHTVENYISLYTQHAGNIGTSYDEDEIGMLERFFDSSMDIVRDFVIHATKTKDIEGMYCISDQDYIDGYDYVVQIDGLNIFYNITNI